MKKLITDVCKYTILSFDNKIYKQTDGVSVGSSLRPVIVNIFMTVLEKFVLHELIMILLNFIGKPKYIEIILKKYNSFDKNI